MGLLYLIIRSFMSGLYCGCMFKNKIFYTLEQNLNQLQALLVYHLCI